MAKHLFDSMWITLAWVLSYAFVIFIGEGLSSVHGYALITGWWFVAFVSSKLKLEILSAVPSMVLFYLVFLICTLQGVNWFYRDVEVASTQRVAVIGALQALIVGSLALFNITVDVVIGKIGRRDDSK